MKTLPLFKNCFSRKGKCCCFMDTAFCKHRTYSLVPEHPQAEACLPNTSIRRYITTAGAAVIRVRPHFLPALNRSDTREAQSSPSLPRACGGSVFNPQHSQSEGQSSIQPALPRWAPGTFLVDGLRTGCCPPTLKGLGQPCINKNRPTLIPLACRQSRFLQDFP